MHPLPFHSIFHPSDFTPGDEGAFAHALKLATAARAELDILHANPEVKEIDWDDFPSVRVTLEKWGLLKPGGSKDDVRRLGLDVHKVKRSGNDPVRTIVKYLRQHQPGLVILATHQRRGLSRWMNRSIAEPIAREAGIMTLFVPRRIVGFVSLENGAVHLENILVPIDRVPDPQRAVDAATSIASVLGCPKVHFTFLHAGPESEIPSVAPTLLPGWTSSRIAREGNVVDVILTEAEERDADLIAMTTQGRDGFLDAFRGSTTEQVLRAARSPVLAIPDAEPAAAD
jgi:nucleotide-binding universal stress UspA family protein